MLNYWFETNKDIPRENLLILRDRNKSKIDPPYIVAYGERYGLYTMPLLKILAKKGNFRLKDSFSAEVNYRDGPLEDESFKKELERKIRDITKDQPELILGEELAKIGALGYLIPYRIGQLEERVAKVREQYNSDKDYKKAAGSLRGIMFEAIEGHKPNYAIGKLEGPSNEALFALRYKCGVCTAKSSILMSLSEGIFEEMRVVGYSKKIDSDWSDFYENEKIRLGPLVALIYTEGGQKLFEALAETLKNEKIFGLPIKDNQEKEVKLAPSSPPLIGKHFWIEVKTPDGWYPMDTLHGGPKGDDIYPRIFKYLETKKIICSRGSLEN